MASAYFFDFVFFYFIIFEIRNNVCKQRFFFDNNRFPEVTSISLFFANHLSYSVIPLILLNLNYYIVTLRNSIHLWTVYAYTCNFDISISCYHFSRFNDNKKSISISLPISNAPIFLIMTMFYHCKMVEFRIWSVKACCRNYSEIKKFLRN